MQGFVFVTGVTVTGVTKNDYLCIMEFVNRENECAKLAAIHVASTFASRMTVLIGRRRIGKTRLIREGLKDRPYLYFFVSRKDEKLLCEEYIRQIREVLDIPVFGEISRFKDVFGLLMDYAGRQPLTLVIDEFQEFSRIQPAVYSEMQDIWDRHKDSSRMNLILSGSVYSLMRKIFESSKEPLFGRANERLEVRPFSTPVLKTLLASLRPDFEPDDLLALYALTGGVPKYVEQFVDKGCLSYETMLDEIFQEHSIFLEEGKIVLIEEFGKEYATYFSILSLLASSRTARSELESILQKDVGGYLNRLENDYQIIHRIQPIFAKPNSRQVKYEVTDNFLHFWFRFLYKNRGAVEIGNFTYLRQVVERDYATYSGRILEKYFLEKLAYSHEWAEIGSYWEPGFQNQIDIVAVNPLEKRVLFAEVKRNRKQYSEHLLREKAHTLLKKFGGYSVEYKGLSLEDM